MARTKGGRRDLQDVFRPRRIAVVGASDQPGNLGAVAIEHLRRLGFPGEIHPVHPSRDVVVGLPCAPSIAAVPGQVDLAVLAVRAALVPEAARACAEAGGTGVVVWAGGFAEVDEAGAALQAELTAIARETGLVVLGPNCIGFIETHAPTVASFASFLQDYDHLDPGHISMVSQSGGLATQAHALAQRAGWGFRFTLSTGNEADLTVSDLVDFLVDDPETWVIALYVEGIRDGEGLVRALARAGAAGKPVVLLKGGIAPAAAEAASAHTGALAGEARVLEALTRRLGACWVHSLEELLDVCLLAVSLGREALAPRPDDAGAAGLAVVTFGGGGGVLAADQAARAGLEVPRLSADTRRLLAGLLPPIASLLNPVDVTPQTFNQPEYLARFGEALRVLAEDDAVHAVLVLLGPMRTGTTEVIDAMHDLRTATSQPVVVVWPFCPPAAAERLLNLGFLVLDEPARAVRALGLLLGRTSSSDSPAVARPGPTVDWETRVPDAVTGTVVAEHACHALLAAAGLPVARGRLVRERAELDEAVAEVGLPLVLKAESAQVLHRDAAGLVAVGLGTHEEVDATYDRLLARAVELGAHVDGIHVQEMVSGGDEILVSGLRDPVLGPVVTVGAGGTLTEVVDDVVLAAAPLGVAAAERLVRELRIVDWRARRSGIADAAVRALATFISDFSHLVASAPWTEFVLEVNPVRWRGEHVVAVDGLLVVERP